MFAIQQLDAETRRWTFTDLTVRETFEEAESMCRRLAELYPEARFRPMHEFAGEKVGRRWGYREWMRRR